ncbi:hypothetical protein [Achromobacter sp. ACRQX]|uniref:hypothetical protein n=1 Tax=Achromobacter sp. ACRQX TaxID=2918181 RepID=UPI001EF1AC25|nr:hypothetical protein [Achromobacter sp. ACRQX]MCG7328035.1 hypothetical protein [Achromobacter sp. ACRQX]
MTCRYTNTDWLDVLYNCVRKTPGGVADAARFLTERRGKSIHPESLRAKLKRSEGDAISVEMADLLSEWMEEKAGGSAYARDWVEAHSVGRHGLAVIDVPPAPEGGWPDELKAIQEKVMRVSALTGKIASSTIDALSDGSLCQQEKDELYTLFMDLAVMGFRGARNVSRA